MKNHIFDSIEVIEKINANLTQNLIIWNFDNLGILSQWLVR